MHSPCGRFTLVYNGEIYNHAKLREKLENQGQTFRGHSDTEVLLASISRWEWKPHFAGQAACLPSLCGMSSTNR